jgi:hypothetical protein
MPEVTDAGDGAPTALIQNLTGGELQDKNEIFISSCKSCAKADAGIIFYSRRPVSSWPRRMTNKSGQAWMKCYHHNLVLPSLSPNMPA